MPSYSKAIEKEGDDAAEEFAAKSITLLLASQIILLAIVWAFTPQFVSLLAPGLDDRPEKFALAVNLTRITFPYLLFMTLFVLHMGALNAHGRFALARLRAQSHEFDRDGGARGRLSLSERRLSRRVGASPFPACCELGLLMWQARSIGILKGPRKPHWPRVRDFFIRLGPAIIGSASPADRRARGYDPVVDAGGRRRLVDLLRRAAVSACRSASSASPPAPCSCPR